MTAAFRSSDTICDTSGCSGAKTQYVAPKSVSGRVVKTVKVRLCPLWRIVYLRPRFSDPIQLHLLEAFGPVQMIQVFEQAFGVVCDFQHPLAHLTPLDWVAGFDVFPVLYLLVGEDGSERGAPIYGYIFKVRQAFLVESEKNPLRPPVILGAEVLISRLQSYENPGALDLPAEYIHHIFGD